MLTRQPSRDERALRAQLAVYHGVGRDLAAELFGFDGIADLHQAECDLRWKASAHSVTGWANPRAEGAS